MNIVVSGVWDFSISSLGAQALSDGLLLKIRGIYPEANVQAMAPASLPLLRWLVRAADGRPAGYPIWFELAYRAYLLVNRQRTRAIRNADLFIVSGDGLVADIFVASTLMFACEIRHALEHGVSVVSLNQSVNISPGSLARYCVARWFMAAPLSVREINSQQALARCFPGHEFPLAIDAAFLCPSPTEQESALFGEMLARLRHRLGIDRYVLVGIRGNRPPDQMIDEDAWCTVLALVQKAFPAHAVLLASTCAEYDMPLARRLAERVPGTLVAEELWDWQTYNYRFFQVLLREADASLSDRYHQNVLAALNGTPFIAVEGNTPKTGGIKDLIEWPIPIQPLPERDQLDGYRDALTYLVSHQAELQAYLEQDAPQAIRHHDHYCEILQGITDATT